MRFWFWIVGTVLISALGVYLFHSLHEKDTGRPYTPPTNSIEVRSEDLRQTVVVPTLDTPIPENHSAIWCSSFVLAWNRLKTDVAKGEIQLKNAEAIADRLNRAEQSEKDLDARDFYAAAGFANDGIFERIQREMRERFPELPAPEFDIPTGGGVAYGFLRAQVKFDIPFFDNNEKFEFIEANGKRVGVKSFGIRNKDASSYQQLRDQVEILYPPRSFEMRKKEIDEFIVDPCKYSKPYQIILASIARKGTLAEAVADVYKKITLERANARALAHNDTLLIPSMHWRIDHHFRELEGADKQFLNPALAGSSLQVARQTIQFGLDRSGAELASEASIIWKSLPDDFHFTRPFLIIMKKRDAKEPFFVMWVDNTELLDK